MTITEINEATQHLTFKLDEEVFAIDISKVREVLEYTTLTKVPQTPDFMCGVINLRGGVVPVVNLRLKFGIRLKTDFLRGMGKRDEQFIMILDIDKVFSTDELVNVQDAGYASP